MPAQNKKKLLAVTEKEYKKLSQILEEISTRTATRKREENTSLKDVIAHRAHWIELFLGWYKDGAAGKEVFFPAKGYKWNQLNEYNERLRKQQVGLSWAEANKQLNASHRKLMKFLTSHTNKELYSGPMKGAKNEWTPGRWAEAAGPSHYRSASKYARQCINQRHDNH